MANNYEVNYDDKRFQEVEADKQAALNEVDVTYGNMIDKSDQFYEQQIQASKDWADKQSQLQQEKTDFAIEQIEQQKEQAQKDYTKEQSGAYVDWQKQSDSYGVNAEKMAAAGLKNTGYAESSLVSMYNAYQNRVALARESMERANINFANSIKEAQLQNSSILAEIAAEALQKQLELSLQGFQYKNQLILEKANKKTEVENTYYQRYQDVLQQINHENALAEEIRQYNEQMALQKAKSSGGSSGGSDGGLYITSGGIDPNAEATLNNINRLTPPTGTRTIGEVSQKGPNTTPATATDYLNALIASGATKDRVSSAISAALKEGEITSAQAATLRKKIAPRGYTY